MARQKSDEIAEFGSDSFLDIVANIVGILIILIVIAGLRVSRAPVEKSAEDQPEPVAATSPVSTAEAAAGDASLESAGPDVADEEVVPLPPEVFDGSSPEDWTAVTETIAEESIEEPAPLPPVEAPPELIALAASLRTDITAATLERDEDQRRQSQLKLQIQTAETSLAALQQEVGSVSGRLSGAQQSAADRESETLVAERELANLDAALRLTLEQAPATKVLNHRVTPIGRQVSGPEVHFRLAEGRVSVVPLESLTDALKDRVQRNKDMLIRLRRYEGTVGPLSGYKLHYVVERQRVSVLEELRSGGPMIRIGLSYYEVEPQADVPTESAAEALAGRSRFRDALDRTRPGATVTFWVYPDSFDLHRRLQEYAHLAGYDVAARPLPPGVPIAGSPSGSRSVAQ